MGRAAGDEAFDAVGVGVRDLIAVWMSLGVRLWRIQCPGEDEFGCDGEDGSRIEKMMVGVAGGA